jgi:hypothetical protein
MRLLDDAWCSAVAMALALGTIALVAISCSAQKRPTATLPIEQSHGDVRVILMRVGQIRSPDNKPAIEVTYAVEIPQQGAFSDLHFFSNNEVTLAIDGKPVQPPGGFSSSSLGLDELPRKHELQKPEVRQGKAMIGQEVVVEGVQTQSRSIDVQLRFSWRHQQLAFSFPDVALK